MRSFLLLELMDPAVNAFLWRLRRIIASRQPDGPIHITLRGPYDAEPPMEALAHAKHVLRYDVLRIGGVGRFSNVDEEVLFLKVDSPHLRSVWWKKSYPIEEFGFTPHISLYRGAESDYAQAVGQFLSQQRLELLCAEHRLVWHKSGQPNLFVPKSPSISEMDALMRSNCIDADVLDRLEDFVSAYRFNALNVAQTSSRTQRRRKA